MFGYIGSITRSNNAGQPVVSAIRNDLTAYINSACAKRGVKPIKSIDRISKQAKEAFWEQLAIDIPDERSKARCSTVTDAIGLITSGKLDAYSEGYWGHPHGYQVERGESGAVSEMFA